MDMRVATSKNDDGSVELYFIGLEHWDDFNFILGLLQKELGCNIISNKELIYFRVAELLVSNISFSLRHDDMLGNFLYTKNPSDVPVLERLANNVIESIKTKLENMK